MNFKNKSLFIQLFQSESLEEEKRIFVKIASQNSQFLVYVASKILFMKKFPVVYNNFKNYPLILDVCKPRSWKVAFNLVTKAIKTTEATRLVKQSKRGKMNNITRQNNDISSFKSLFTKDPLLNTR